MTFAGTKTYMAPEVYSSTKDYDARCDVWSLGVLAFELWAGELPFDGEDEFQTRSKIISGKFDT